MRSFAVVAFAGPLAALLACGALLTTTSSGCGFPGAAGTDGQVDDGNDGPGDGNALSPPWWSGDWAHRRRVAVTTGPRLPDKGYAGYTAFLTVDTSAWSLRADCRDLRLLVWKDPTWTDLPVHRLRCGGGAAELRFALPFDLADDETWRDAFLSLLRQPRRRMPHAGDDDERLPLVGRRCRRSQRPVPPRPPG